MKRGVAVLVMAAGLAVSAKISAQSSSSLYFMEISTQRQTYNPAFIAPYETSFTVPFLGGLHARVDNNFFSWNALVRRDDFDSLHMDLQKLVGKAGNHARVMAEADAEIFRFSWRRGRDNFQIGLNVHADMQLILKKETLSFLMQGPGAHIGDNLLTGNRLDVNSYAALYFGYARQVSKHLTVGGRVKVLQGLWNLHTDKLTIAFDIQNEDMSDPDVVPYRYELGVGGRMLTNLPLDIDNRKLGSLSFPLLSMGAAIDLGVSYDFGNWNVSGAIRDLGFIVWGDDHAAQYRSYKGIDDCHFSGIHFDEFKKDDFRLGSYMVNTFTGLLDTLNFAQDTVKNSYTRALPVRFTVSLSYTLRDIHVFGVAFDGMFYNRYFSPELMISYTCMPGRNFGVCVSNTFSSGNVLGLGLAFVVNAGPLQIHLGVDRLNSFNVAGMRTANVNFGLNLVLGKSRYDWFTGKSM